MKTSTSLIIYLVYGLFSSIILYFSSFSQMLKL